MIWLFICLFVASLSHFNIWLSRIWQNLNLLGSPWSIFVAIRFSLLLFQLSLFVLAYSPVAFKLIEAHLFESKVSLEGGKNFTLESVFSLGVGVIRFVVRIIVSIFHKWVWLRLWYWHRFWTWRFLYSMFCFRSWLGIRTWLLYCALNAIFHIWRAQTWPIIWPIDCLSFWRFIFFNQTRFRIKFGTNMLLWNDKRFHIFVGEVFTFLARHMAHVIWS